MGEYVWHEEDLIPAKHRSHITEEDRTDEEVGYEPNCGFWYRIGADLGGMHTRQADSIDLLRHLAGR